MEINRTLLRPRHVARTRSVAFQSDSGSGVINDIVGLIAFRRGNTRPPRYPSYATPRTSPVIGEKCFNFVSSRVCFHFRLGRKKVPVPDKSDLASVKYSLYPLHGEKILIPIHARHRAGRGTGIGRKYRVAPELTVFYIFIT